MSENFRCAWRVCLLLALTCLIVSFTSFLITAHGINTFSYVTALLGSNVFVYGIIVLLLVSLFSLAISVGMIYALFKNNDWLLTVMSFSSLSVASMAILSAALGFCLRTELANSALQSWMGEGLRTEYGHPHDYHVTHAWDRLQTEMSCCGVNSEREWVLSDWFLGQVKYPRRRRPSSCCKSCTRARDEFCTASLFESLTDEERRTCAVLTALCPQGDSEENHASVCAGNKLGPTELPEDAFVYGLGCYPLLETHLFFYSTCLIFGGTILAILLLLETISIFILNYTLEPTAGDYDAVNPLEM